MDPFLFVSLDFGSDLLHPPFFLLLLALLLFFLLFLFSLLLFLELSLQPFLFFLKLLLLLELFLGEQSCTCKFRLLFAFAFTLRFLFGWRLFGTRLFFSFTLSQFGCFCCFFLFFLLFLEFFKLTFGESFGGGVFLLVLLSLEVGWLLFFFTHRRLLN